MSASDSDCTTGEARVNQIIADYLQAIERGEVPDRAGLLARHADIVAELSAFFADHDRFQRAAAPLADALTLPPCDSPSPGRGPKVAYFGDYELLEEIARGGMGIVYKARQMSLNRPVALKMILAGEWATPEARQRFRAEAEAAANLQHPNIVAIHEVGEHEGQQYFSMDFVVGNNLAQLVRGNPLSAGRAASYVKTIAEAVHFAHQRGTLHRDLKPQNVLIDADDRPRITDFGLAKRVETDSDVTRTGDVIGSPSYMPPEQASSRPDEVGPHSDVYSLGAILYELLTARPPFRGATAMETLCQVIESPPVSLRKRNPDVPPDLETICLKCLEKRPERRYHSARELAEELGRFLNREPIHARPVSLARRGAFWARRHPWVIRALASLFLVGLTLLCYGLWAENRYLVWLQANPGHVRAAGPRTDRLKTATNVGSVLFVLLMAAYAFYSRRAERPGSLKSLVDPAWALQLLRSRHAPSSLLMLTLGILGGAGVVYSVILVAMITEAYVWEATRNFNDMLMAYGLFLTGGSMLLVTVEGSRRRSSGSSVRLPAPADLDPIRQAVLAGDVIGAVKLYRRQARDVSLLEAREFVARLVADLEAVHPGRITANVRALYSLNPNRLLIGLLIEGILVGSIVVMLAAEARLPWMVGFLCGWLLGCAVFLAIRFRRIWQQIAIWLVALLGSFGVVASAQACSPGLHVSMDGLCFPVGAVAGIILIIAGVARRPTRQPKTVSNERGPSIN
jgi:tRNA A-37 threonylcarbamoyl transferase component Bud32